MSYNESDKNKIFSLWQKGAYLWTKILRNQYQRPNKDAQYDEKAKNLTGA